MGRRRGTTAFPVARIKKMMQADDEVGKIATVTPMLVAKALECMMELVVTEAAQVAIDRRSRTVSPLHLKTCVMNNESFDFLRHVFDGVEGSLEPVGDAAGRLEDSGGDAVGGGRVSRHDRSSSSRRTGSRSRSTASLPQTGKRPRSTSRSREMDMPKRPARSARGERQSSAGALASTGSLPHLSSPAMMAAAQLLPPITGPKGVKSVQTSPGLSDPLIVPGTMPADGIPTRPNYVNDDEEDYDDDDDGGDGIDGDGGGFNSVGNAVAHDESCDIRVGANSAVCGVGGEADVGVIGNDSSIAKTTASTDVDGDEGGENPNGKSASSQPSSTDSQSHSTRKADRVSVHALLS